MKNNSGKLLWDTIMENNYGKQKWETIMGIYQTFLKQLVYLTMLVPLRIHRKRQQVVTKKMLVMKIVVFPFFIALLTNVNCSGIFLKASNTGKKYFAANSHNFITQQLHDCSSSSENVCHVVAPKMNDREVEKAQKDLKIPGTISQIWMKGPIGKCN